MTSMILDNLTPYVNNPFETHKMWVVILTLHWFVIEFKRKYLQFSNSTWKNGTYSMILINFYFSSHAFLIGIPLPSALPVLHWQFKAGTEEQQEFLWTTLVLFGERTLKIKTQSLDQWAWQMLQFSKRIRNHVHQLSSSPNEKNQVLRIRSICLSSFICHRCGEERKNDQKLKV